MDAFLLPQILFCGIFILTAFSTSELDLLRRIIQFVNFPYCSCQALGIPIFEDFSTIRTKREIEIYKTYTSVGRHVAFHLAVNRPI